MTRPYITADISDPSKEFKDLSSILFGASDSQALSYDSAKRSKISASKDAGLFAYFIGIEQNISGYTFAEAEKKYGSQLKQLQGSKIYLLGTGKCSYNNYSGGCFTITASGVQPSPALAFDFVDDGYNLVGAFEMLRKEMLDGQAPEQCGLSAATFGSDDIPLCSSYHSHNLLVTPYSLTVRGVRDYYQNQLGQQNLDVPMSRCE